MLDPSRSSLGWGCQPTTDHQREQSTVTDPPDTISPPSLPLFIWISEIIDYTIISDISVRMGLPADDGSSEGSKAPSLIHLIQYLRLLSHCSSGYLKQLTVKLSLQFQQCRNCLLQLVVGSCTILYFLYLCCVMNTPKEEGFQKIHLPKSV